MDVRLYQTNDGGEIDFVAGQAQMSDGLETAVYLSLFGGNERDSGQDGDEPLQWWGNLGEADQSKHYRSETQHLLRSLPATTANLRRIEDAIARDLAWMTDSSLASSVSAEVSVPALNRIDLLVRVEIDGEELKFPFTQAWRGHS
jgi:phage gp46-like protein